MEQLSPEVSQKVVKMSEARLRQTLVQAGYRATPLEFYAIKIQDGGGRRLEFRKISITLDLINIYCIKLYRKMHHGYAEMTT